MIVKLFEIRDRATMIPAMAIKLETNDEQELFLLRHAGWGQLNLGKAPGNFIYLIHLPGQKAAYDVYEWDNRSMQTAHGYIEAHFDTLTSGEVIDVEFILEEKPVKKNSERFNRNPHE